MRQFLAVSSLLLLIHPFHAAITPLGSSLKADVVSAKEWHAGCPVALSQLRVLTVTYWGFDSRAHSGQLIVNARVAPSLESVFKQLYALRFPIRHMSLASVYGPVSAHFADGDPSGSFECRQAVPSPCSGGTGTGSWSMHAYGEAVDLNPVENPYVGCGMSRDKTAQVYIDRSQARKGMVTAAVVAAFRSAGWGWGGSWSGSTKDYMHFSSTGH